MRKVFLFLSLCTVSLYAQNEEVYNKIAGEACTCLQSKNIDLKNQVDGEKLTMMFGLCIIESYNNHKTEVTEDERKAFDDKDGMRALGEKIAMKMITQCPDFLVTLGQFADDDEASQTVEEIKIEGKVSAIETKQFVTIKLKDKNGRIHNLLLLDYFETASLFTEGQIKNGSEITVGYSDVELYDTVSKDFKYFKVITSLEKK